MIPWADTDAVEIPTGETLIVDERLVLSPCSGRFRPPASSDYASEGEYVQKGQVMGSVVCSNGAETLVRSMFAGWMMGYLLPYGAPVVVSEPVLWLRCK